MCSSAGAGAGALSLEGWRDFVGPVENGALHLSPRAKSFCGYLCRFVSACSAEGSLQDYKKKSGKEVRFQNQKTTLKA